MTGKRKRAKGKKAGPRAGRIARLRASASGEDELFRLAGAESGNSGTDGDVPQFFLPIRESRFKKFSVQFGRVSVAVKSDIVQMPRPLIALQRGRKGGHPRLLYTPPGLYQGIAFSDAAKCL